jgi:thiol-disulfide isomerase/thioredoxin
VYNNPYFLHREHAMSFPTHSSILRIVLAASLLGSPTLARSAAPDAETTADEVMTRVKTQADTDHKKILLTFGASWCGNCRLFDRFLADPKIHAIMSKEFVFADLDTGEHSDDKRHANIPGGPELQSSLGGKSSGYPYIVMIDSTGRLIANSLRPVSPGKAQNIGYPDAPYEIDWFMEMLKTAAPAMSPQDTATIRSWLKAHSTQR